MVKTRSQISWLLRVDFFFFLFSSGDRRPKPTQMQLTKKNTHTSRGDAKPFQCTTPPSKRNQGHTTVGQLRSSPSQRPPPTHVPRTTPRPPPPHHQKTYLDLFQLQLTFILFLLQRMFLAPKLSSKPLRRSFAT